eukprot:sb/3476060/
MLNSTKSLQASLHATTAEKSSLQSKLSYLDTQLNPTTLDPVSGPVFTSLPGLDMDTPLPRTELPVVVSTRPKMELGEVEPRPRVVVKVEPPHLGGAGGGRPEIRDTRHFLNRQLRGMGVF